NGRDLPRFTAGSHIGVRLGEEVWRDYSLWNDPAERRRYCIAVLREKLGEGSRRLHDAVRVGDSVEVSLPRNHFALAEAAERHLPPGLPAPCIANISPARARRRRPASKMIGGSGCVWCGAAANTRWRRGRRLSTCCAGMASRPAPRASSVIAAPV